VRFAAVANHARTLDRYATDQLAKPVFGSHEVVSVLCISVKTMMKCTIEVRGPALAYLSSLHSRAWALLAMIVRKFAIVLSMNGLRTLTNVLLVPACPSWSCGVCCCAGVLAVVGFCAVCEDHFASLLWRMFAL